jgi:hypothetical protein
MIPNPKRKCEYEQCKSIATWGVKSIPERCDNHKQQTDRDLVIGRCVACNNPSVVNDKQMCGGCDTRGGKIRLGRQLQVKAALDNSDLPLYDNYDKIAFDDPSCGRERPDFMWDAGTYKVILEVDEDQHKSRPCECEQTRMVNITQGLFMSCLWIRYNPDEYKGQKSTVRDRHRLDYLIGTVRKMLKFPPLDFSDNLRVVHLFFDGFKMNDGLKINKIKCI